MLTEETISPLEPIFLVEGELDALTMIQAGFNCVALPGANFNVSPALKSKLSQASELFLAGDSDDAGNLSMSKLWAELNSGRTFRIKWPGKDANDVFVSQCKNDVSSFRILVEKLSAQARSIPTPYIHSVREALEHGLQQQIESPFRLHFPWRSVDSMAVINPGNVFTLFASQTKSGKTTWAMNLLVYNARKYNEVCLHYITEATIEQYVNFVAAHLLQKNRRKITLEDRKEAAKVLGNGKLYVGQNPNLNRVGPTLDFIEKAIQVLGPTIVILDHIHHIVRNESDTIKAQEDAFQRIVQLSKKYMVKFGVVGQPRKPTQQLKNKPVTIYDFKGSEVFESDPDAIFILHRNMKHGVDNPEMATVDPYEPKTSITAVGRELAGGPTYTELFCIGEIATFTEMTNQKPVDESPEDALDFSESVI